MVQVNVGGENMGDLLGIETGLTNAREQSFESCLRAWIDEGEFVTADEHVGADDVLFTLEW